MKIKSTGGHLVNAALSFSFQIVKLGGSYIQKYNTIKNEYVPDRVIAPYVLKPSLFITDPDGKIPTGEYSTFMVNVLWTLTSYVGTKATKLVAGADYSIDASTHAISIYRNTAINEIIHVDFSGDYLDKIRNKVWNFSWNQDLSTIAEAEWKTVLVVDTPSKLNLSPFKNRGIFTINSVLKNGDEELDESICTYLWQKFNTAAKQWVEIDDEEDFWYVSGKNSKTIAINQDYVQRIQLRLTAYANDNESQQHTRTFLLRRFYGMYDTDTFFANGKYLFPDTTEITIGAKVTNRSGDIAKPTRYFDIELFYRWTSTSNWQSIGYGEEVTFMRDSQATDHQSGVLVRELSAFMPIELPNGSILCNENGIPIVAQFPVSSREVE